MGLDDKLLEILAEIQKYPQLVGGKTYRDDKKKVMKAIDAIKASYASADEDSRTTYLTILERGLESDKDLQVLNPRKAGRDRDSIEIIEDSSLVLAFAESTPQFLPYLNNSQILEMYLEFVFMTDDKKSMTETAKALPEYLCMLEEEKFRKTARIIWRAFYAQTTDTKRNHLVKPHETSLRSMPHLDVLSDKKKRDVFLDISDRLEFQLMHAPVNGIVDNLEYIEQHKDLFLQLTSLSDDLRFSARTEVLVRDPQMLEYLKDDSVLKAFERIEQKMHETAQHYYRHSVQGLAKGSAKILKHLPALISEGLLDTYLEFAQRAYKRTEMDWFNIAVEASGRPNMLRNHSELYFEIIDEFSTISRELGEEYDGRASILAIPLMASLQALQDTSKRQLLINAISRIARTTKSKDGRDWSGSACSYIFELIDILQTDKDVDDLLYFIKKRREITPTAYPGDIIYGGRQYLLTAREPGAKSEIIDKLLKKAGKSFRENTLAEMLRHIPTRTQGLETPKQRSRYLSKLRRFENMHIQNKHVAILLDNPEFFEDADNLDTYVAALKRFDESERSVFYTPTDNAALLKSIRENIGAFRDPTKLDMWTEFLGNIKRRGHSVDVSPFLREALKYQGTMEDSIFQKYLRIMANSISNAPSNLSHWAKTGFECAARFGERAEKYFKHIFKDERNELKIDELAAMEILLAQAIANPQNNVIRMTDVKYVESPKDLENAITAVMYVSNFLDQVRSINSKPDTKTTTIPLLKTKFRKDFSDEAIDALCAKNMGDPLKVSELQIISGGMKREMTRRIDADEMLQCSNRYISIYRKELELLIKETEERGVEKNRRVRVALPKLKEWLRERKDIVQGMLFEMEDHDTFNHPVFEMLKSYIHKARRPLENANRHVEIRLEENALFLDDLMNKTEACNSRNDKQREATLIYKIDRDAKNRPNQTLLSLNSYADSERPESLGQILLIRVKDKEDSDREKLLVEFTLVAEEINKMVSGPSGEAQQRTRFNWQEFILNGVARYAREKGYKSIIINTEHKTNGQECLHEFNEYVAKTLKKAHYALKATTNNLCSLLNSAEHEKQLFAAALNPANIEQAVVDNIDYTYLKEGDGMVFRLTGPKRSIDGFEYTHHLEKAPMDPEIVKKIAKPGWNGESYLDSWYQWAGHQKHSEEGIIWNDGTGYITGIEINLDILASIIKERD